MKKVNFSPNEWESFKAAGCYPYVMNWTGKNRLLLIGERIGKPMESFREDKVLIATLKEELECFGYTIRECGVEEETPGCRKIYLMRDNFLGRYHLFREDQNGWSHKYPGKLPTNLDFDGNLLTNPESILRDCFRGWCFAIGIKTGR